VVESRLPSNHLLRSCANLRKSKFPYRDANTIFEFSASTSIYAKSALAGGAMRRSGNTLPEIAAMQLLLTAKLDANCVTVG
jgi:hypothetical protein